MTTLASLCITLLTALPLQRFCAACGAAMVILGFAAFGVSPAAAAALISVGGVVAVFGVLLPVGLLFHLLSAPGVHRFTPKFRVRMLAALVTIVALPSVLAGLLVTAVSAPVPLAPVLIYPASLMSALIWVFFFLPASLWVGPCVLVILHLAAAAEPATVDTFMRDFGPYLGAVLLLFGWTSFAVWYLRASRIRPFRSPVGVLFEREPRSIRMLPEALPLRTVLRMHLWRVAEPRARGWSFAGGVAAAVAIVAAGFILLVSVGSEIAPPLVTAVLMVSMVATVHLGREAACHARRVWLKTPWPRRQLFSAIENALLRLGGERGVVIIVIFGAAMVLTGMPAAIVLPVLIVAVTTALLGAYIGLMSVRGARIPDVVVWISYLFSVAYAVWVALEGSAAVGQLLPGIAAAQALAALGCRAVAAAAWRDVDWLVVRPPKPGGASDLAKVLTGRQ